MSRLCQSFNIQKDSEEVSPVANTKEDFMTIEHSNVHLVLGSITEIILLTKERNVEVLCIIESWLLPYLPETFVYIPGYKIFRCDNGRKGDQHIHVQNV